MRLSMETKALTDLKFFQDQLVDPGRLCAAFLLDAQKVLLPVFGLVLPLIHFTTKLSDGFKLAC